MKKNELIGVSIVDRETKVRYPDPHHKHMEYADLVVAQRSKDPASKVGAILVKYGKVIAEGCNQLPDGCEELPERYERPDKYDWMNHAEPTVICNAAKDGIGTRDADMYINWYPCLVCAGFIVQAGIKRLFADEEPDWNHHKWGRDFHIAKKKLEEGGVEVIFMNYEAHRQGNV